MGQQLETVGELVERLAQGQVITTGLRQFDAPVYARTPHGTFHFVITDVEDVEHEGEDVVVLVLKEVEW